MSLCSNKDEISIEDLNEIIGQSAMMVKDLPDLPEDSIAAVELNSQSVLLWDELGSRKTSDTFHSTSQKPKCRQDLLKYENEIEGLSQYNVLTQVIIDQNNEPTEVFPRFKEDSWTPSIKSKESQLTANKEVKGWTTHNQVYTHLCKKHIAMIWEQWINSKHKGCNNYLVSLDIVASEVLKKYSEAVQNLETLFAKYYNSTNYEERMIEIRKQIQLVYNGLHQELIKSEKSILNALLECEFQLSEFESKAKEREAKDFQKCIFQIIKIKQELENWMKTCRYDKIYEEKEFIKKYISAIKVVNNDIQFNTVDNFLLKDTIDKI